MVVIGQFTEDALPNKMTRLQVVVRALTGDSASQTQGNHTTAAQCISFFFLLIS